MDASSCREKVSSHFICSCSSLLIIIVRNDNCLSFEEIVPGSDPIPSAARNCCRVKPRLSSQDRIHLSFAEQYGQSLPEHIYEEETPLVATLDSLDLVNALRSVRKIAANVCQRPLLIVYRDRVPLLVVTYLAELDRF